MSLKFRQMKNVLAHNKTNLLFNKLYDLFSNLILSIRRKYYNTNTNK